MNSKSYSLSVIKAVLRNLPRERGRIIASLNFDIEVEKAIEILQDTQLYNQILNNE